MKTIANARGQGTVEAACVIPVMLFLLMLLVQPGIVMYDYIVMNGAAAEACRLAATSDDGDEGRQSCIQFVKNRLAAVPQHEFFHVHDGGCTWHVEVEGGESSGATHVLIENEIRPLPLFDAALKMLGATDASGHLKLSVEKGGEEQPAWLRQSVDGPPPGWIGEWQ